MHIMYTTIALCFTSVGGVHFQFTRQEYADIVRDLMYFLHLFLVSVACTNEETLTKFEIF